MLKLISNSPRTFTRFLHTSKMPAFTLYSSRGSSNTDRVRLTLAEGGFTDYETVIVNLAKGEQKVRGMSVIAKSIRHYSNWCKQNEQF
jgi:hypothetical protein